MKKYSFLVIGLLLLTVIPVLAQKNIKNAIEVAIEQQKKTGRYFIGTIPLKESVTEKQLTDYCIANKFILGHIETKQELAFGVAKSLVISFEFRPADNLDVAQTDSKNKKTTTQLTDPIPKNSNSYSDKDMILADEFSDNRNDWVLKTANFGATIQNSKLSFTIQQSKYGPYQSVTDRDENIYNFEIHYSMKVNPNMMKQGLILTAKNETLFAFGVQRSKIYLVYRGRSLFGANENNLSSEMKSDGLILDKFNTFSVIRRDNTLEFLLNNRSVGIFNIRDNEFSMLSAIQFFSENRSTPIEIDNIFIKKRALSFNVTNNMYNTPALANQNRIKCNEQGEIVVTLKSIGNYTDKKYAFSLEPDSINDKIAFLNTTDTAYVTPTQTDFTLKFKVKSGIYLPIDSIRFKLRAYVDGHRIENKLAFETESFFSSLKTQLPSQEQSRQKVLGLHYGYAAVNEQECVRQLNNLANNGDKIALAWKGLFTHLGDAGFPINEDLGKVLMQANLSDLTAAMKQGDIEALYLIGNAYYLGFGTKEDKEFAPNFIAYAAQQKYPPAVLDYSLAFLGTKNYVQAKDWLEKAEQLGCKKATTYLAKLYEKGLGISQNSSMAIQLYEKAISAGDVEAMMHLANMYYGGQATTKNTEEAIRLATKAASQAYTEAMLFLGKVYFEGQAKPKDKNLAFNWFSKAAQQNNREAMAYLGLFYLEGSLSGGVNEKLAFEWTKKAAEAGYPSAMARLSVFYDEGKVIAQNKVLMRYWANKAAQRGVGQGASITGITEHPLFAILNNSDFSTHTIEVTKYSDGTTTERDLGPDYLSGFLGGLGKTYIESRMKPMQEMIDGLEFIQKLHNTSVYGGTLSSRFVSSLMLKANQKVNIKAGGVVKVGFFWTVDPDGHYEDIARNYNYSDAMQFKHGSLLYKIGANPWQFNGTHKTFTAEQTGPLVIAINDRDYSNNQGYFDIIVTVLD